jgi:hypothetical protein
LETSCQRCHETLREEDRYCPACGLPQLTYIAVETAEAAAGEDTVGSGGLGREVFGVGSGIAWRPALKLAAMLAIPTGYLGLSVAPPLGLIGVSVVGAWLAVMYARRTRTVHLRASVGARIGMVMGLMAGWFACCAIGVGLWITRFVLHQGSQMDSRQAAVLEESLVTSQQFASQMGAQGAQMAENAQMWRSWTSSTQGRAEFVILEFAAAVVLIVVLASIGGAAGARFLAQPRRPSA